MMQKSKMLNLLMCSLITVTFHLVSSTAFAFSENQDLGQDQEQEQEQGENQDQYTPSDQIAAPFQEKKIISIISEPENNRIHDIILNLKENGDILSISRKSDKDRTIFTVEEMRSKEVVLARTSGMDAVLLGCKECTSQEGGQLNMRYLNNGLTKAYKNFQMQLVREGQDLWSIYTEIEGKNVKIETLRLRSRKVGDMLVGIRRVDVNQ